jgi:hypothetical protein
MTQPSRTGPPAVTRTPQPVTPTDLEARFSGRWSIMCDSILGVWSGERRSRGGRHIVFLSSHSPAGLVNKIADAELVEP